MEITERMAGLSTRMRQGIPAEPLDSSRALKIAIGVAVVVHLVILAIEITQPEDAPPPVIEITLDAPQSDRTRDAGQRTADMAEDTPTKPALAGQAGPESPTDSSMDEGAGHQRKGSWGASDSNRPVSTQDQIDQLHAQVNAALRTGYVTSRTQNGPEGRYLARWKRQIEVYGNQHYPRALIEGNISGEVVLEATISKDGKVLNLAIRKSSGSTTLDNAARNLLQAASPYPAFPEELAEKRDRLVITRTWVFTSDREVFDQSSREQASP